MSCYKDIKDNYKNDIKNNEEYSKLATYQKEMEWLPEDLRFDAYIGPDSDSAIKHLIAILEKIPHFTGGSSLKDESEILATAKGILSLFDYEATLLYYDEDNEIFNRGNGRANVRQALYDSSWLVVLKLIEAINERLPIEFEFGKSNNEPNWYKVKPKLFV